MVLDDDEIVRRMVVKILQRDGLEVMAFPDAGPALTNARFEDVDIVITDLSMPTAGEEFIQIIRERGIQVPVVVVSGHVSEDNTRYLETIGAQAVLSKPFKVDHFLQTVRRFLTSPLEPQYAA